MRAYDDGYLLSIIPDRFINQHTVIFCLMSGMVLLD